MHQQYKPQEIKILWRLYFSENKPELDLVLNKDITSILAIISALGCHMSLTMLTLHHKKSLSLLSEFWYDKQAKIETMRRNHKKKSIRLSLGTFHSSFINKSVYAHLQSVAYLKCLHRGGSSRTRYRHQGIVVSRFQSSALSFLPRQYPERKVVVYLTLH